jgi:anti-sigma B factor antagonist
VLRGLRVCGLAEVVMMMMPLTLTHRHLPGVTVIAVGGELDTTNHRELENFLEQVRQGPADQVVFDLAGLRFMDSRGLSSLLACHQACLDSGGEVRVAALQATPARLLSLTGVDAHVVVHDTVEQAIAVALAAATSASG